MSLKCAGCEMIINLRALGEKLVKMGRLEPHIFKESMRKLEVQRYHDHPLTEGAQGGREERDRPQGQNPSISG